MKSLRAKLVVSVVGTLALAMLALAGLTYAQVRSQVGALFDEELKQVALALHLREDWQDRRVGFARPGFLLSVRVYDANGRVYFETALPSLPQDLPHTFGEGFARLPTSEGPWRVYTHVAEGGVVQVGQAIESRDRVARELSLKTLLPVLLLIPLLGALIAWMFRRGLAPLDETSRRVSDRDASRLDPLPTEGVPLELLPLIEQINGLLRRLEDSFGAQRRFLADAAHELRSPVGALALQVQLAARADSDAARSAALEELAHGVERARRLVQQLLDYARIEAGAPTRSIAPVDLARLARDVVAANAVRAERLGVDLGAEALGPVRVQGVESELRSLVENLVDNALRYSPRDSAVTIAVRQDGARAHLTVVDTGPGIPPAERERVFERFHRVPGDETPGSGLGLSIVKAIVEGHRGTIELSQAENDPGAGHPGLRVRVAFPLAQ